MVLLKVTNGKAKPIGFSKIRNENELQGIVENNLPEIFGLTFVESEFRVSPFRIDTLAFDGESKSLVIIEYKESEDYSVIDQGYSYLNLLLNHKGDSQLALERRLGKRVEVDWSQSRIVFIAKSFNAYQLGALANNLPFELWKYTSYEDGLISFEQLVPQFANGAGLPANKIAQKIAREIRVYTVEDHIGKRNENVKALFEQLQKGILNLNPEVKDIAKKQYIAYKLNGNFAELVIQAWAIIIYLDIALGDLKDRMGIAKDCTKVGHWATGGTRFKIQTIEEVPHALELIGQVLERKTEILE
jgi:predicted transport protein